MSMLCLASSWIVWIIGGLLKLPRSLKLTGDSVYRVPFLQPLYHDKQSSKFFPNP